jgi:hypothetical protein
MGASSIDHDKIIGQDVLYSPVEYLRERKVSDRDHEFPFTSRSFQSYVPYSNSP